MPAAEKKVDTLNTDAIPDGAFSTATVIIACNKAALLKCKRVSSEVNWRFF
jgi:hypothetical protein